MSWAAPPTAFLRETVARALAEDVVHGDVTTDSLFQEPVLAVGTILAEEPVILAGLEVALEVFAQIDSEMTYQPSFSDGDRVPSGAIVLTASGDGRSILKGERVALNFLQRLSGIATLTAQFCDAVKGTTAQILDTRKTTPGLRALEKWAVKLGGGQNHRGSLGDGVLIKDNHIELAGADVAGACQLARMRAPHSLRIEVEARTLEEVHGALEGKADIILLDNMQPAIIQQAVQMIKGQAVIEVSGGVTLANVREIALTGVELISVGALTHSAPAANFSLDLVRR
jgi:nicotinate-nucleotide pyrophosphorylase (carboxylating)